MMTLMRLSYAGLEVWLEWHSIINRYQLIFFPDRFLILTTGFLLFIVDCTMRITSLSSWHCITSRREDNSRDISGFRDANVLSLDFWPYHCLPSCDMPGWVAFNQDEVCCKCKKRKSSTCSRRPCVSPLFPVQYLPNQGIKI